MYHVVIAPDYEPAALGRLKKRRDLRILKVPVREAAHASGMDYSRFSGGILIQDDDHYPDNRLEILAATNRGTAMVFTGVRQFRHQWGVEG